MALNDTPTTTTGVVGPFYVHIDDIDIVEDQSKVTTGFFTGNVGTLAGSNLTTASLSTAQKKYYYNFCYYFGNVCAVQKHLGFHGI